jgi:hypothetical protein
MTEAEKRADMEKHRAHLAEKDAARREKRADKQRALGSLELDGGPTFTVIEFDFEKNLMTPSGFAYYSKLTTHNFTMLELATNRTICYIYEETEGLSTKYCNSPPQK